MISFPNSRREMVLHKKTALQKQTFIRSLWTSVISFWLRQKQVCEQFLPLMSLAECGLKFKSVFVVPNFVPYIFLFSGCCFSSLLHTCSSGVFYSVRKRFILHSPILHSPVIVCPEFRLLSSFVDWMDKHLLEVKIVFSSSATVYIHV